MTLLYSEAWVKCQRLITNKNTQMKVQIKPLISLKTFLVHKSLFLLLLDW